MNSTIIYLPVTNTKNPDWEYMDNFIGKLYSDDVKEKIKTNIGKKKINLDIKKWKEFKIKEIFEVKGTKTTPIESLYLYGKGAYPYITTKATNNGVDGYFNYFTEKGNVLTIDSAVLGYCSYQAKNFSASDHVEKLILKNKPLNKFLALFLVTIINNERFRYSYGRKFSQKKIKESVIKLPVDTLGNPNWEFMENYIKSLPYSDKI